MRRKNTGLKNYSKRKNLKKSNTKMKGGQDKAEEERVPEINFLKYIPENAANGPYDALENMIIEGEGVLLGWGNFGKVLKFTMERPGGDIPVAVKIIRTIGDFTKQKAKAEYDYQSELSTMKGHSKYFAKVYNFFSVNTEMCGIVMEFLEPKFTQGLELFKLIEAKQLSEERQVHYCLELARAISATHKKGIVHGDLKPENVAITEDGSKMGQLKLVDFGLSFKAGEGDEAGKKLIDCCQTKYGGSPLFFSYEIIEKYVHGRGETTYGAASDWWSYGVMVFEIAMGMGILDRIHHPCFFCAKGTDSIQTIHDTSDLENHWGSYLEGEESPEMAPDQINQYFNYKRRVIDLKIKELEKEAEGYKSYIEGLEKNLQKFREKHNSPPSESETSEGEDENEPFGDTLSLSPEQVSDKIESMSENIEDAKKKKAEKESENELRILVYRAELETMQGPTEAVSLLLRLAFQFFVEDPKKRPFLCLDEPQMEAYDGTRRGVRAEALQKIVDKLEQIEAKIIQSSL